MKHIGIILSQPPVYSETFLNSKIKNLMEAGFKVTVFSQSQTKEKFYFEHKKAYPAQGNWSLLCFLPILIKLLVVRFTETVKFYTLGRAEGQGMFAAIKNCYLNAHIILNKPDWLHFEFATLVVTREHLAKALQAKLSVSIRGYDMAIYPLKNPNCYQKLWKYIDKLHTISDNLALLAKHNGLPASVEVVKITPAIYTSNFSLKSNHGLITNKVKIISTGRLNWIKGVDYQIYAASILKQLHIDFTWVIIGDGNEFERCTFLINQHQLQNHFILLGKKNADEIAKLLGESDIYVQYSNNEGFCNAVLEAQSTGLVTIVSDAGALPENVLHSQTGFIVPKRNPQALANQIVEVIKTEPEVLKAMTLRASNRVSTAFDIQSQAKKFIEFYQT